VPIAGEDAAWGPGASFVIGQLDADAPRQRQIALAGEQGLLREMDRDQSSRACGLHADPRPGQTEQVTHPGRQIVRLVRDLYRYVAEDGTELGVEVDVVDVPVR